MPDLFVPPEAREFEVSLFGPGVGECVVLHLGANEWITVDSCAGDDEPSVALEYFARIGVDPTNALRAILVTHWHDDHVRGAASLFAVSEHAPCFASMALQQREFLRLVAAGEASMTDASGVREMGRILAINQERTAKRVVGLEWVMEDRVIYRNSSGATVTALSPSSQAITRALLDIAKLLPQAGQPKRAIVGPSQTPNEASIALWVTMGDVCALLGGDLENGSTSVNRWEAIVSSTRRPAGRAEVFKVPHHGSVTAEHPGVWSQMLADSSVSCVAPYARGVKKLPSVADIERLKRYRRDLYCTAPPEGRKPKPRDPSVERTMKEVLVSRSVLQGKPGHVRLRWKTSGSSSTPSLDLFPPAFAV